MKRTLNPTHTDALHTTNHLARKAYDAKHQVTFIYRDEDCSTEITVRVSQVNEYRTECHLMLVIICFSGEVVRSVQCVGVCWV